MPGFDLAASVATLWPEQSHEGTIGLVLMNHGLFTVGADTGQAYERHIALIDRAQRVPGRACRAARSSRTGELPSGPRAGAGRDPGASATRPAFPLVVRRHRDRCGAGLRRPRRPSRRRRARSGHARPHHPHQAGPGDRRRQREWHWSPPIDATPPPTPSTCSATSTARAAATADGLEPERRVTALTRRRACARSAGGPADRRRTAKDAAIAADIYHHTIDIIGRGETAGRLPGAAEARAVRRGVLGPGAGQAAPGGRAADVRRPGRARHRSCVRDRKGLRGSASRGRRRRHRLDLR